MNEFSVGNSGPEGIRTPDLLSAIEARSQLRYRPVHKANDILPEAYGDVKQTFSDFSRLGQCVAPGLAGDSPTITNSD